MFDCAIGFLSVDLGYIVSIVLVRVVGPGVDLFRDVTCVDAIYIYIYIVLFRDIYPVGLHNLWKMGGLGGLVFECILFCCPDNLTIYCIGLGVNLTLLVCILVLFTKPYRMIFQHLQR